MNKMKINNGLRKYTRITKTKAKKLFFAGSTIALCPVNLRPGLPYGFQVEIVWDNERTFDDIVNSFEYYNCSNETGKYTAFYTVS